MVGRIARFTGLPGQFQDQCRRKSDTCRLAIETSTKVTEWSASHPTNGADGVIQSQTDTVRITAGTLTPTASYTIDVDNAGTIMSIGTGGSNGQALDFNDLLSTIGEGRHDRSIFA